MQARGNVKRAGVEGIGRALMVLGMGVMRRERRIDEGGEGAVMTGRYCFGCRVHACIARRERDGGSAGDGYMKKMGDSSGGLWQRMINTELLKDLIRRSTVFT